MRLGRGGGRSRGGKGGGEPPCRTGFGWVGRGGGMIVVIVVDEPSERDPVPDDERGGRGGSRGGIGGPGSGKEMRGKNFVSASGSPRLGGMAGPALENKVIISLVSPRLTLIGANRRRVAFFRAFPFAVVTIVIVGQFLGSFV